MRRVFELRYDNAMKRNERILNVRLAAVYAVAVFFMAFNGAIVFAQNALDGSLHVGSGGVNTTSAPSARPVRRDTSQTRNLSQGLGLNPYDDFIRIVSQTTGSRPSLGQVQRVNDRNALPPTNNPNDWKKRDPLQFDSQGLALTINSSRAMSEAATPFTKYRLNNGEMGVMSASNLRGVKFESERDQLGTSRMSLYETARLREDVRNNTIKADFIGISARDPFRPYQSGDAVMATKTPLPKPRSASQNEEPFDNRVKGYDAVMREVKQRFEARFERDEKAALGAENQIVPKDEKASRDRLLSAYDQLKRDLAIQKIEDDTKAQTIPVTKDASKEATTSDSKPNEVVDPEKSKREGINMTIDEYALVLKHGQKLDSMTGEEKNRFNQLLSEGQRAMFEGNAFVAEKRFQVALSIRPDDPIAISGMLHCQISANLPGSAALTLHELFTNHPEMMDVKWGAQTIPPRPRLEKALVEVGRRIAIGKDAAKFGLLQAYIGHLLNNQDAVTAGLFALRGTPGDDNMSIILRKLWVDPATDMTPQKINPPVAP
jgi:hypothetical protein